jgi:hypothetical protein
MPLRSLSLTRLLGLSVLLLGLLSACGGGEKPPPQPPPPKASPSASRSSVAVDRATGIRADGADRVTITVTVRDGTGEPLAGESVSVEVSGAGNTVTQPVGKTNASGVATASVVSTQPGVKQVTGLVAMEDGALVLDEHPSIEFGNPPATKLAFSAAALSATAGEPIGPVLEVFIQDAAGRTVADAVNEITLAVASGPPSAVLEGALTVRAVNGVARFPGAVLKLAGSGYTLRATASGLASATSPAFDVRHAAPVVLIVAGVPSATAAATPVSAGVTLRDAYGNVATGYRGTVRFTSTDPAAVLPADYTFTATDNGTRSFPVTLNRVGERELRVQDTAVSTLAASVTVTVSHGVASQFVLTAPPGPFVADQGFPVEVLVQDSAGNVATGYRGTVHFDSRDPIDWLPADYTFTAADSGRQTFNVVLRTATNPQKLTVTDTARPTLTATLDREIVAGPPTLMWVVTHPVNTRVRATLSTVQVELTDDFHNRARVSSPTVVLSTLLGGSNPAASLSGTLAADPVDGLATFTDLSVDQEGEGFQVNAAAGALAAVNSEPFDVIDDVAPGTVTLTSTARFSTSITLEWTAAGDDGSLGKAGIHELRYSTQPITTLAEFDAATLATFGAPLPGSAESFTVANLNAATTYYFAVVARDLAGNASRPDDLEVATLDPCAGVVCEVPEPTCAVDGVTRVTFASACVLQDNLPTCQDTETRMLCPGAEGVCFAGACGTATGPAAGELTVTEVMHSPSTGTTEYIELHNSSQRLLNIAGLQVDYLAGGTSVGGFTVNPGPGRAVLIPAGGLFVLGSTEDFATNGGVAVDYAYGSALELGTEGRLAFRSASGTSIADFPWTVSFPQTPGSAMNLASTIVGTGGYPHQWYWCDSSMDVRLLGGDYGTPGQPNESCGLAVGPAPAFCNIQYPKTFPEPNDPTNYPAIIPYGARRTIYSQFSGPHLTDRNFGGNDDYPHVQVELGYGMGADPSGWQWSSARFNPFYNSTSPAYDPLKDESWGWLRIFTPGTYSYGFRYRLYDPAVGSFSGYTYCDQNGVAADPIAGTYGTVTVSTEPLGPAEHIVFSEFASRGVSGGSVSDTNEFIELHNPTSAPVDISGWKIQHMPANGPAYHYEDIVIVPAGTVIASKGYYLIAHNDYAGATVPDLQYSQPTSHLGGHLRVGPGTLGSDPIDLATADKFGWGPAFSSDGDPAPVVSGAAGSLERKAGVMSTAAAMEGGADTALGNGSDTDWNADDWIVRTAREPQNSTSPPEPL